MENQPALSATAARATAARQQLRLQAQRQQLALRQAQTTTSYRDARHEMNHTLTLGFSPALAANVMENSSAAAIESRFRGIAERLPISDLAIQLHGRTATISGQTLDDSLRRLAVRMLSMEPGVSTVDNRITVVPPSPRR